MAKKATDKAGEEVIEEEVVAEDSFEDAWDEDPEDAGGDDETPTDDAESQEVEEEPEPEPEPKEPEDEPAKEEPADDKPGDSEKGVDALEQVQHKYDTISGMYNSEIKKRQAAEDELALLKEGTQPKPDEKTDVDKDAEPDASTIIDAIAEMDEVKALAEEFGEEGTNAFKAIAGKIYTQIKGEMSQDLKGKLGEVSEKIDPLQKEYAENAGAKHWNAIDEAHPDNEKYVDNGELQAWVEGQTGILKGAYEGVLKDGNAADVIDLFTAFKKAKGYDKAEEKDPEDEVDNSKLEDMEVVEDKKPPVSSGRKRGVSDDDFGGAFDAS